MDIAAHAIADLTDGALIADFGRQNEPIVCVNEAFTSITGYTAGETLDRAYGFFVLEAGDLKDGAAAAVVRRKTGDGVDCRLTLVPLRSCAGADDPVLVLIRPLGAQDAADAAMYGSYLRAIVHDLRSPLSASTMWTEILTLNPAVEPPAAEGIASIKRNLQAMTEMLDRLSMWAQLAFDGIPTDSEPCTSIAVLEELDDRWQALAASRGVDLVRSGCDHAAIEIHADKDAVVQALNALIDNALRAAREGGRVALRIEAEDDSVIVTVQDDGPGLTSDEIDHVFEPFWRGSNAAQGSFGLGLAIAKRVAIRHRGTLCATSEGPGLGAAFTLRLPARSRGQAATD